MTPLRVQVPKRLIDGFRAAAIEAFPKERYAVFLGHRKGTLYRIQDVWYPDRAKATDSFVEDIFISKRLRDEGQAIADSDGLEMIADIHSHPWKVTRKELFKYRSDAPSGDDWRPIPDHWVHAICTVHKAGRKTVAAVKFWPSLRAVDVELL